MLRAINNGVNMCAIAWRRYNAAARNSARAGYMLRHKPRASAPAARLYAFMPALRMSDALPRARGAAARGARLRAYARAMRKFPPSIQA